MPDCCCWAFDVFCCFGCLLFDVGACFGLICLVCLFAFEIGCREVGFVDVFSGLRFWVVVLISFARCLVLLLIT